MTKSVVNFETVGITSPFVSAKHCKETVHVEEIGVGGKLMEEEVSIDKGGDKNNVLINEVNMDGLGARTRNKTKAQAGGKELFDVLDDA